MTDRADKLSYKHLKTIKQTKKKQIPFFNACFIYFK